MNDSVPLLPCESVALDLPALADRRLDAARSAVVREHLAHCARCTRELRDFEEIAALLASEPEPTLEELGHARLALRRAMVAGAGPRHARPGRGLRLARSFLLRAATFLLSTALLVELARETAIGAPASRLLPEGTVVAEGTPDGSLLGWVRSVRSAAQVQLDPWLPDWSLPSLLDVLPSQSGDAGS